MMKYFLSCDWGTTSFRIRLVDTETSHVLVEELSDQGIGQTYRRWQQTNIPEEKRVAFYLDTIRPYIKKLEEKSGQSMKGIKLIISGMASSSIGIVEIPYSNVPLPIDGSDIKTFFVAAGEGFEHDVLIVSGVKTDEDVMRGEETQLIGCTKPGQTLKNELFIFPGTHSKHVWVKDGYLINFKTYMTGEVFALLTQHSILKNTVEQGDEFERGAFRRGVRDAVSTNILQSIFKVRTNLLFGKYTKSENYSYLSGLLVGTELQDLALANAETINLVCGHNLGKYYHLALLELLPGKTIKAFSTSEADEASVKGHLKISKQLKILE